MIHFTLDWMMTKSPNNNQEHYWFFEQIRARLSDLRAKLSDFHKAIARVSTQLSPSLTLKPGTVHCPSTYRAGPEFNEIVNDYDLVFRHVPTTKIVQKSVFKIYDRKYLQS